MPTKPTCGCWVYLEDDYIHYLEGGRRRYWDKNNDKFCRYCGAPAEEVKDGE